ncbi:flavin monoamine oxidase family protein [Aspergillus clavatus NRRL 1]|uniref:L-amino acid oxidase LaoA n=1 Tax=Aspergillus clavatus (strain ATCC 1007 / CBS 513.65 / DSM 816 / NCTC 3887 / NRRL 1 / QM 1276 / 107) TaxID=344612 RepID=A1CCK4_ASPCL|nr:L-amino acid oxidase LaoA [Aspergillus clavatus NRRL 1]EAW12261.1 L-amino acid oxidase LaoA [Aspergillus clavatus NRRL 1]
MIVMKAHTTRLLIALSLSSIGWAGVAKRDPEALRLRASSTVTADSLHNIHVEFLDSAFEGDIQLVYGDCSISDASQRHHEIGTVFVKRDAQPERFVWITPSDIPHLQCLHVFSGSSLVGRSSPISVAAPVAKRASIADVADAMGPWFDGVAYMKAKEPNKHVVAKAKDSSVAIVGGGMSGLMTSLLLESVGIHNWHIYESSGRVGGRIRTKYLNNTRPDEYQYQEMGPMRFPVSIKYAETNETLDIQDHKMVFQLADLLNEMNAKKPDLQVNFVPWTQRSPNVPASSGGNRLADGRIPTAAQVAANSTLVYSAASSKATAAEQAEEAYSNCTHMDISAIKQMASNMFKAHKAAVEDGMFHWSEAGYLRYAMGYDTNITDYVAGSDNSPIWGEMYENVYFAATEWRTIDKGLESLPRAIYPHVAEKTTLNRKVSGLSWNATSGKIAVNWREDPFQMTPEGKEYDYAVVAAPFSKVRLWELPRYSSLLSRAIATLNYDPACKMALHYKSRFWEHQPSPIFGGCGSVDVPGVGSVCYPSYNINGTGPGVVLASYLSGTGARSTAALSVEDHVALVQRTMVEIHGPVAEEEFTGVYDRQCWEFDEHQAGAWAGPLVGQQELYLPAYYQTEFKTIFVGEHTSYTHAWIFSALDSAVRGTTQLLLDLGLVDEAKSIVNEWMGRWISV